MTDTASSSPSGWELVCPITNVQRFSVHDGPGIRTLVFTRGCPLCCRWCANPEGQSDLPELLWAANRCIHCGSCVDSCPHEALRFDADDSLTLDSALCTLCGSCDDACPTEACVTVARAQTVEQVMTEIRKDKVFYDLSGGGVTFGGGEPAVHSEFVSQVFEASRDEGINTAIETCGYVPWDRLEQLRPHTDLFLYDVKHADPATHLAWTGVDNAMVFENLERLLLGGARITVRTPVIHGFNADRASIAAIASRLASLSAEVRYELLPYHRLGEQKYERLHRVYQLQDCTVPDEELMSELAGAAAECGLSVHVGG